ncbi:hypothetical protein J6590_042693 [Homalodisca vitripennis]|nr:hypothetical protein J6590_042693 [Homalodisca vitripennis]
MRRPLSLVKSTVQLPVNCGGNPHREASSRERDWSRCLSLMSKRFRVNFEFLRYPGSFQTNMATDSRNQVCDSVRFQTLH